MAVNLMEWRPSICEEVLRSIQAQHGEPLKNSAKFREIKKVEILEAEACSDHIHMLVSIPLHISISQFIEYLKGKSSLVIFDRHTNLKYKYGARNFWCRGYYADTVGRNKKISEDIKDQLEIIRSTVYG